VLLPAATALPLQAGDVVAISGVMDTLDGERAIRADAVRLTDMRIPPIEKEAQAWPAPGSRTTRVGRLMAPGVLRASGTVTAHTSTGLVLTCDGGARMEVVLTGRKDCGVEEPETPIPAPPVLSNVEVTGVLTLAKQEGALIGRVRPRVFEDVRLLGSSAETAVRATGLVMSGPFRYVGGLRLEATKQ
jgi:hypothetical protein